MAYIHTSRPAQAPFPRWSLLVALAALLAAFAIVLSGQGSAVLQRIEQAYADLRTSLLSDRISTDHPDIAIVSVGDNVSATRATFGQRVEVDRAQLARIIDAVDDSAPRAIGLDVPLNGATDSTRDAALQRALREAKARVVVGLREGSLEGNPERRAWLERFIAGTGRPLGHVTTIYDGLRATRVDSGVQAIGPVPDSFALLVAKALRTAAQRDFGPIAWLQKVEPGGFLSRFLNLGGQSPFRVVYAQDLLDTTKPLPSRQLAGRLVLVTTGLAETERHRTPLTVWTGEHAAPIQIQAQAIAQMVEGRTLSVPEPRQQRLLLFTLACIAGFLGWYGGLGAGLLGTLLALAGLVALDALAYSWYGLLLPFVPALLVWMLGETAGRCLRHILAWEERHGYPWPLVEDATSELEAV